MTQPSQSKANAQLVLALACGATAEAVARQAQLSARTVKRRLADPAFRKEVQQARTEMVQRAAGTLTAAATESIKTLLALQKENQPPATRLGAAKAVLELGMRLREVSELEERMAAVRRGGGADGPGRGRAGRGGDDGP